MSDLLQNLIDEPYADLAGDADFKTAAGEPMVDFIVEDKGDLQTQIDKAMGRGTGLACIIDLVDGKDDAPDAGTVVLNPISIVYEISEKTVLNRKGTAGTDYLTLRQVLAMLMAKHKHFEYSSGGVLVFTDFKSVPPPRGADAAYQLYFDTAEALKENTASYAVSGTGTDADGDYQDTGVTNPSEGDSKIYTKSGNYDLEGPVDYGGALLGYVLSAWVLVLEDESEQWTVAGSPDEVPTSGWSQGSQGSPAPTISAY